MVMVKVHVQHSPILEYRYWKLVLLAQEGSDPNSFRTLGEWLPQKKVG